MGKPRYQPPHCRFRVAQKRLKGLHPSLDEILTGSLWHDKSFGLCHPVSRGRKLDENWITVYQPVYLSLFSPGEGQESVFLLHTAEKYLVDLIRGFFTKCSPGNLFSTFSQDGMRVADKWGRGLYCARFNQKVVAFACQLYSQGLGWRNNYEYVWLQLWKCQLLSNPEKKMWFSVKIFSTFCDLRNNWETLICIAGAFFLIYQIFFRNSWIFNGLEMLTIC